MAKKRKTIVDSEWYRMSYDITSMSYAGKLAKKSAEADYMAEDAKREKALAKAELDAAQALAYRAQAKELQKQHAPQETETQ